ncbi:UNVERIFIED_CONTAM: hypothetical protein GTU68_065229 [Idotea baltica]|nr:hypothetical protein [Idotea baltica]
MTPRYRSLMLSIEVKTVLQMYFHFPWKMMTRKIRLYSGISLFLPRPPSSKQQSLALVLPTRSVVCFHMAYSTF